VASLEADSGREDCCWQNPSVSAIAWFHHFITQKSVFVNVPQVLRDLPDHSFVAGISAAPRIACPSSSAVKVTLLEGWLLVTAIVLTVSFTLGGGKKR